MPEILPYSKEYRDDVIPLVRQFFDKSLNHYGLGMEDDVAEKVIESMTTFLLIKEGKAVGIIGGNVIKQIANSEKLFQEVIWYVDENHRGGGLNLLKHLEAWCAMEDIDQLIMAYMHNSMGHKMIELYERMGYAPMETHYIRDLKNG